MMSRMRLSDFERRWVDVIARALVPPAEAAAAGLALDGIDAGARFDEECARWPWYAALALRFSLWLAWLSPVWMRGRPRSFGAVDEAAQVALLERLFAHRLYVVKMAALLLKLTLCGALLGDVRVLGQLGAYDLPRQPRLPARRAS